MSISAVTSSLRWTPAWRDVDAVRFTEIKGQFDLRSAGRSCRLCSTQTPALLL